METRANYVIVGLFTIVAILAIFGFIYWTAGVGERGESAPLQIRIPGSASGLSRGSAVLFNGVKVGDVRRVYLDLDNPQVAIADAEVDRLTPITRSTRADVGLAGLTGQANIELKGGDPQEPNLLELAAEQGRVAQITASPSAVTNLLQTAQSLLTRADSVLSQLEDFATEAREPLAETVRNIETFSGALASNADGIDAFLASVGELSGTITGLSERLESTLSSAEALIEAVDREQVATIVDNVETFSGDMGTLSARLDSTLTSAEALFNAVDGERVATIVENVETFSSDIRTFSQSLERNAEGIDTFLASVGELSDTITSVSTRLDTTLASAEELIGAVDREQVTTIVDNIEGFSRNAQSLSARLEGASGDLDTIMAGVNEAVQSFGTLSENANKVVGRADGILAGIDPANVNTALTNFEQASVTVNRAANEVAKVTETLGGRSEDIDQFITDASQLASRLNEASVRVDGVLAKLDGLLGSDDAESIMAEASETLAAYRQVAETLNARIGTITDGLARFSGQGLRDVEALIRDSRRSINRIEQAITSIEQNPQRIITGGEGEVRRYEGRIRR